MKKPLLERFQQLAGIKPLSVNEQESDPGGEPYSELPPDAQKMIDVIEEFVKAYKNEDKQFFFNNDGEFNQHVIASLRDMFLEGGKATDL